MLVSEALQQRHYDYVLGPNQDVRLASVAAGAVLEEVLLEMDSDAPFVLTGRAVRHKYTSSLNQANLAGLKSKWTGPTRDYRQQGFILESLQMAYYGQFGNPKPIVPGILYPARSVLMLDLKNTGPNTITNLQFFFRGFKLYPKGTVPAYTYPKKLASQTFSYPVFVSQLGVSEFRQNQIFTCKGDADFVLRAGQGIPLSSVGTERAQVLAEVSITLKDHAKQPYSNDFMPFDILFGVGAAPAVIPLGPAPSFVSPFGTGPGQPGLFYPEIYVPKNHQLLYDLQRADGAVGGNQAEDFTFNLIGGKVFEK
jgi:hypothetical protein